MASLKIICTQDDVKLGEKVTLIAMITSASAGSVVTVDIQDGGGMSWPATVHVNSLGSGGAVSSDVVLPGSNGVVAQVVLTGSATSTAPGDVFAPASATVRVHG